MLLCVVSAILPPAPTRRNSRSGPCVQSLLGPLLAQSEPFWSRKRQKWQEGERASSLLALDYSLAVQTSARPGTSPLFLGPALDRRDHIPHRPSDRLVVRSMTSSSPSGPAPALFQDGASKGITLQGWKVTTSKFPILNATESDACVGANSPRVARASADVRPPRPPARPQRSTFPCPKSALGTTVFASKTLHLASGSSGTPSRPCWSSSRRAASPSRMPPSGLEGA